MRRILIVIIGATHRDTHASPILAVPGHADGHHDGKVCLSEWKSFFDWCTEKGEGEKFLVRAEKAAAAMQKRFNARVEAVFKAMDTDKSGDLSMPKMERVFGEETHEFWEDMDGEMEQRYSHSHGHSYGLF